MALPPGMSQEDYDELLEDMKTLKKAIRAGVLECMYGDKRVIYRSLNEMKQILNDMKEEAGLTKTSSLRRYAEVRMGFGNC